MSRTRFEFNEGSSSKFWEIEQNGQTVTTWWGRIGTEGQSKSKDLGSPEKAQHEFDKLIEEKTDKGYEEVDECSEGLDGPGLLQLKEKLKHLLRQPWKPKCKNGDGAVTASKFSGIPWLAVNESWPACKHCTKPMQLFVQLDTENFPEELRGRFGSGLVQMFYCILRDCMLAGKAYSGNDTTMLLRLVQPNGESAPVSASPVAEAFPAKEIVGWTALPLEYPEGAEIHELGIELDDDEDDAFDTKFFANSDDKLYGWPGWVQGPDYGICKLCGTKMELLMQIGSNDNLPYMFGDAGIAHIMQCTTHKDQLKFCWSCH